MPENSFDYSEVTNLSDEQLFESLITFGVDVGPIIASTRKVYEKKLIRLMGGDVVDSSFNNSAEEYSESDNEFTTVNAEKVIAPKKAVPSSPKLRARTTATKSVASPLEPISSYDRASSLSFDHDRHTPSPRPSLRTVSSSTTKYYTSSTTPLRETTTYRQVYSSHGKDDTCTATGKKNASSKSIVKWILFVVILVALYFAYQHFYSESPLRGLGDLAKQALNSAKDQKQKSA